MLYFDDWDDTENMKSAWCREQLRLLRQLEENEPLQHRTVDMLQEMAKHDYDTAESATILLMEHLLYVIIAPNDYSRNHWLAEVNNFIKLFKEGIDVTKNNMSGNTNLKKKLKLVWQVNYKKAVKKVLKKANDARPQTFILNKIPQAAPWSLEDFLTKTAGELTAI